MRKADVIEIGTNAAYDSKCGTAVDCYAPEIPAIQKNLNEIVGRVDALTSGHEALIVLRDYWNV